MCGVAQPRVAQAALASYDGSAGVPRPARAKVDSVLNNTAVDYWARGRLPGTCALETDMTEVGPKPWPTELRLHKDRKSLSVTFDSGESFDLSAEYLRVKSPSAEVQGHSPDERKTVAGKKNVAILELHPIGNYAVRLLFDDMHSTGIYSWDYLLALGRNREAYWRDYLDDLAGKGLTR
jgi:DUF971 family protein